MGLGLGFRVVGLGLKSFRVKVFFWVARVGSDLLQQKTWKLESLQSLLGLPKITRRGEVQRVKIEEMRHKEMRHKAFGRDTKKNKKWELLKPITFVSLYFCL
jgi:hypothetical protein